MKKLINLNKSEKMASNKKFGWFLSTLFVVSIIYSKINQLNDLAAVLFIFFLLFLIVTILADKLLTNMNIAWYKLGLMLEKFNGPILLGIIFFGLITPIALFIKFIGRDELKLNKLHKHSYWIDRSPPGPQSESFKNQY